MVEVSAHRWDSESGHLRPLSDVLQWSVFIMKETLRFCTQRLLNRIVIHLSAHPSQWLFIRSMKINPLIRFGLLTKKRGRRSVTEPSMALSEMTVNPSSLIPRTLLRPISLGQVAFWGTFMALPGCVWRGHWVTSHIEPVSVLRPFTRRYVLYVRRTGTGEKTTRNVRLLFSY